MKPLDEQVEIIESVRAFARIRYDARFEQGGCRERALFRLGNRLDQSISARLAEQDRKKGGGVKNHLRRQAGFIVTENFVGRAGVEHRQGRRACDDAPNGCAVDSRSSRPSCSRQVRQRDGILDGDDGDEITSVPLYDHPLATVPHPVRNFNEISPNLCGIDPFHG